LIVRNFIFIFAGAGLWACSSHLVVNSNQNKVPLNQAISNDSKIDAIVKPYKDSLDKRMSEVVAISNADFIVQRPSSNLTKWVASALFANQPKMLRFTQPIFFLLNNCRNSFKYW